MALFLFANVQASVENGANGLANGVQCSENNIQCGGENDLDKKDYEVLPTPGEEDVSFEEDFLEDEEDYEEESRFSGRKKAAIVGLAIASALVGAWLCDWGFYDGDVYRRVCGKIYGSPIPDDLLTVDDFQMPKCFEAMEPSVVVGSRVIASQNSTRALFREALCKGNLEDKQFLIRFATEQRNPFYGPALIEKAIAGFDPNARRLRECFRDGGIVLDF